MKLTKSFKPIVISILLVANFIMVGLFMTACANNSEKLTKDEEIRQAVSSIVDFLQTAKDDGNYSSVSEFSDGSIYRYYTQDGKIKVEYNEVFYVVKVGNSRYKISQAEDLTWHKSDDDTDLSEPENRINNLINGINNTTDQSLWTDYDSKTKILTATFSDGSATLKLDAGEFIITFIKNSGTTKHTIKYVGKTSVTLPENVIDDTVI